MRDIRKLLSDTPAPFECVVIFHGHFSLSRLIIPRVVCSVENMGRGTGGPALSCLVGLLLFLRVVEGKCFVLNVCELVIVLFASV